MSEKESHVWASRDGSVIRCESKIGFGPYDGSSGCNQQIERLLKESVKKWVKRREEFRERHLLPHQKKLRK